MFNDKLFTQSCTSGPLTNIQKLELYFEDQIINKQKFELFLFPWVRIDELKKQLSLEYYHKKLYWKDLCLFCKNIQLHKENKRLVDYNIQNNSLIYIRQKNTLENIQNGVIVPYQLFDPTPKQITNLLINVQSGLRSGRHPILAMDGTSGTYMLENHLGKKVALYKPYDQQPFTPNNPRKHIGKLGTPGYRKGILSGQSATRQVAAYLLDQNQFHKVPSTTYVEFYHPLFSYSQVLYNDPILCTKQNSLKKLKTKHGSLQEFIQSIDVVANLGSGLFDIDQVHKIGILDIRILNTDRNEANILVQNCIRINKDKKKNKFLKLIPIDHGLSFPDNFEIYDYQIEWMRYQQSQKLFSQKSIKLIKNINPIKDCQMLRQKLGFRQICLRNFRIAQTYLKKMTQAGFTLKEMGDIMYRKDDDSDSDDDSDNEQIRIQKNNKNNNKDNRSQLQKLVLQAQNIYYLVKQNGIKSTVQFQLDLIKMRKHEDYLPEIIQQKFIKSQQDFQCNDEQKKKKQIKQLFNNIEINQDQNSCEEKNMNQNYTNENKRNQTNENKRNQNSDEKDKEQRSMRKKKEQKQYQNNKKEQQYRNNNNNNNNNKNTSIEKVQGLIKKQNNNSNSNSNSPKRNISLPHLKKKSSTIRSKRIRNQYQQNNNKNNYMKLNHNKKWQKIFFHYFEDLLDRLIIQKQKQKKNKISINRKRLFSQDIQLN